MAHKYHLVINNPTPADYEEITAMIYHSSYKRHKLSEENAPSTGTFHIHLYIEFKKKISFGEIKQMFKRAHIEKYYGDVVDIEQYINKDEKGLQQAMRCWGNSIEIPRTPLLEKTESFPVHVPLGINNIDLKFSQ